MSYDLRRESWIPWLRRSGKLEWGPPATLVSQLPEDPVVAIASPRPDFDGALQEFLIGLLTAALLPADDDHWLDLWNDPPPVGALQQALDALPDAFDLDGNGPRFFQDWDAGALGDCKVVSIDQLFIDAAGEETKKLNKDLFVKRDRVVRLGRPAAAMALLTLQTYAPAGGQGHRTSMRGGGPMTTLIDLRADQKSLSAGEQPLWQKLWGNVETREQLAARTPAGAPGSISSAFPWMSPTRTSCEGGIGPTTPADVHPLNAYFGMPRRIRLEFGAEGTCGLTDQLESHPAVGFRTRNYGTQYDGWRHPLSPYYRAKPAGPWLPVHPQPRGIVWRDWLSLLVAGPPGELREPAFAVASLARRGPLVGRRMARIHAFGYDMDKMKARSWVEASLPAFVLPDESRRLRLYNLARQLTEATSLAGAALLGAVKAALFQNPAEARGELDDVDLELWSRTEQPFYAAVQALVEATGGDPGGEIARSLSGEFLTPLRDAAFGIFDQWAPLGATSPEVVRRRVVARHDLLRAMAGYGKLGAAMFEQLGISPPDAARPSRASSPRSRKEKTS